MSQLDYKAGFLNRYFRTFQGMVPEEPLSEEERGETEGLNEDKRDRAYELILHWSEISQIVDTAAKLSDEA